MFWLGGGSRPNRVIYLHQGVLYPSAAVLAISAPLPYTLKSALKTLLLAAVTYHLILLFDVTSISPLLSV